MADPEILDIIKTGYGKYVYLPKYSEITLQTDRDFNFVSLKVRSHIRTGVLWEKYNKTKQQKNKNNVQTTEVIFVLLRGLSEHGTKLSELDRILDQMLFRELYLLDNNISSSYFVS